MNNTILKLSEIEVDNNFNCRGEDLSPADVFDVMTSIKEIGLLSPVLVRPNPPGSKFKYFLFAGFRRFAACKYLKRTEIQVIIHPTISDRDMELVNLIENLKRQQLNIVQEARGVNKFLLRGEKVESIAKALEQGRDWVNVRIALLQLPDDIQREAAAGILNQKAIKELLPIYEKDVERAYKMVAEIRDRKTKADKRTIEEKSKKNKGVMTQKKVRPLGEVFQTQEILLNALGTSLASRALAWAIGEVSTWDFMNELKKEMDLLQLPWLIPAQYYEPKYKKDKVNGDLEDAA